ncbi:MAG: hypothetical protein ACFB6R_18000 [Alphaproteobacteria bacterium]
MGRLLSSLIFIAALLFAGLFAYYGTIEPCEMLAEERKGLVERLVGGDVKKKAWSECAAELPEEWWENFTSLWSKRPAADL